MKKTPLHIIEIKPTHFYISKQKRLFRLINVIIQNKDTSAKVILKVKQKDYEKNITIVIDKGENVYAVYVPDSEKKISVSIDLLKEEYICDHHTKDLNPGKKWDIHLIHYSHHDLGFTDLASNVLAEYNRFYYDIITFCDQTNNFPEEAKFRYVIEESWSLVNFIRNSPPSVVKKLLTYIKAGRIELTALYGNLITEMCGTEELIRALYPAFELKRKYGIKLSSATLNDVTGVSWGLAKILAGCGIKYFTTGFPYWYFSQDNVRPLWDENRVMKLEIPGAFIWKSQNKKEILLWNNIHGGTELFLWDITQAEADIAAQLDLLDKNEYPFPLVSYTVRGGARDNSPPSKGICDIVKNWSHKWTYPKLRLSTNNDFLTCFASISKGKLPELSGEIPNTDYNIGAISTAKETALNRATHNTILSAEKFALIASKIANYPYPADVIEKSYENMLFYDEHCWGGYHIAGPANEAKLQEKSNFAHRAAALSHDILLKSTNCIVDKINIPDNEFYIVMFNPLGYKRSDIARVLFCELQGIELNMRTELAVDNRYSKIVAGTAVGRNIVNLPYEIIENGASLIDMETGKEVTYQIFKIDNYRAPIPYAPERFALGKFDKSQLYEMIFKAENIPSVGYKTYKIVTTTSHKARTVSRKTNSCLLENKYYRVKLNKYNGTISSIYDKELKTELVDQDSLHKLNQVVSLNPDTGKKFPLGKASFSLGRQGTVCNSIVITNNIQGCPEITQEIILYNEIKRIDLNSRILRNADPLLNIYIAFPFHLNNPHFRFAGSGEVLEPIKDQLPGSNSDYYTIQDWTSVYNKKIEILLTSVDAPVVEFGNLHDDSVSSAHHGITPSNYGHEFQQKFNKGHIYSYLMNNNFRTNFSNTQVSNCLFRYSITSTPAKKITYSNRSNINTPLIAVCTKEKRDGILGVTTSFATTDKANISIITIKKAADGKGIILRFMETEGKSGTVSISLPFLALKKAYLTNMVEENQSILPIIKNKIKRQFSPFEISTIRIDVSD